MNNNYELYHFGILGMKWGIRRFQNEDGTLTPAGKKRYYVDENGKKISPRTDLRNKLIEDRENVIRSTVKETEAEISKINERQKKNKSRKNDLKKLEELLYTRNSVIDAEKEISDDIEKLGNGYILKTTLLYAGIGAAVGAVANRNAQNGKSFIVGVLASTFGGATGGYAGSRNIQKGKMKKYGY